VKLLPSIEKGWGCVRVRGHSKKTRRGIMYMALIILHVIAAIFLVVIILMLAGRGEGLSGAFGGGGFTQALFGAHTPTFLTRLTTALAIIFLLTSLTLAILASYRGKSLMDNVKVEKEVTSEEEAGPGAGEKAPQTKPETSRPEEAPSTP